MSIINKNQNTPGPGSYDNKSLFRSTSEKNFGITIGFGRDVLFKFFIFYLKEGNK
jgi:hypothetical protein